MKKAIELLKSHAASTKFQAQMLNATGLDESMKIAEEYLAAAQVLEYYVAGRENTVALEAIVQEAKDKNARCGALIAVRDVEDGYIDMDVKFFPTIDNDSPAHQTVSRVVQMMNATNKAENDAS